MRDGHKLATSTCPTTLSCSNSQHEVRKLLNVEPKDYVQDRHRLL